MVVYLATSRVRATAARTGRAAESGNRNDGGVFGKLRAHPFRVQDAQPDQLGFNVTVAPAPADVRIQNDTDSSASTTPSPRSNPVRYNPVVPATHPSEPSADSSIKLPPSDT